MGSRRLHRPKRYNSVKKTGEGFYDRKATPATPVIIRAESSRTSPLQQWWDQEASQIKRQTLFFLMLLPPEAYVAAHRVIHRFS
jgi:hypothetical protein